MPSMATEQAENAPRSPKRSASADNEGSLSPKLPPSMSVPMTDETLEKLQELKPLSKNRRRTTYEKAHNFQDYTYPSPTYCDICNGLLVGLWSQGLRCSTCGMNVHRGEGLEGHDDCRAEALLTSCNNAQFVDIPRMSIRSKIRGIANIPIGDIKQQMDKDVKAHAKRAIVKTAVKEEKIKKFKRIKARLVPFIEKADEIESRGELKAFLFLIKYQALFAIVIGSITHVSFALVLYPRNGVLTLPALNGIAINTTTVMFSLHATLFAMSLSLKHIARLFRRKVNLVNQFLIEVARIEAEDDLGISVDGASKRSKAWSQRIFWTSSAMWYITAILWFRMQPPVIEPVGATRRLLVVASIFACIIVAIGVSYFHSQNSVFSDTTSAISTAPQPLQRSPSLDFSGDIGEEEEMEETKTSTDLVIEAKNADSVTEAKSAGTISKTKPAGTVGTASEAEHQSVTFKPKVSVTKDKPFNNQR